MQTRRATEMLQMQQRVSLLEAQLDTERVNSSRAEMEAHRERETVRRLQDEAKGAQAAIEAMHATIRNMTIEHAAELERLKVDERVPLTMVKELADRHAAEIQSFQTAVTSDITTLRHLAQSQNDALLEKRQRDDHIRELEQKLVEHEKIQATVAELLEVSNKIRETNKTLTAEKKKAEERAKRAEDTLSTRIAELEEGMMLCKQENQSVRSERDEAMLCSSKLEAELAAVLADAQKLKDEIAIANLRATDLSAKTVEFKAGLESLQEEVQTLTTEKMVMAEENRRLVSERDQADGRVRERDETLALALVESRAVKTGMDDVQAKVVTLLAQVQDLQATVLELRKANETLTAEKADAVSRVEVLTAGNTSLRAYCEQMKQDTERIHLADVKRIEELETSLSFRTPDEFAGVKRVRSVFSCMTHSNGLLAVDLAETVFSTIRQQSRFRCALFPIIQDVLLCIKQNVKRATSHEAFVDTLADLTDTFHLGLVDTSQEMPKQLQKYERASFSGYGDHLRSSASNLQMITMTTTSVLQDLLCLCALVVAPSF